MVVDRPRFLFERDQKGFETMLSYRYGLKKGEDVPYSLRSIWNAAQLLGWGGVPISLEVANLVANLYVNPRCARPSDFTRLKCPERVRRTSYEKHPLAIALPPSQEVFVIDEIPTNPVDVCFPWKVLLHNATDVLHVLRERGDGSNRKIAELLLSLGTPFALVSARHRGQAGELSNTQPRVADPRPLLMQWHRPGWLPDSEAFDRFLEGLEMVLRPTDLLHAAVQRGGIIWRVARLVLDRDPYCAGGDPYAYLKGPDDEFGKLYVNMLILVDEHRLYEEHCQEVLTDRALEVIIGTYEDRAHGAYFSC